jgi:hypothetical protein
MTPTHSPIPRRTFALAIGLLAAAAVAAPIIWPAPVRASRRVADASGGVSPTLLPDRGRSEALQTCPELGVHPILYVVRPQYRPDHHSTETMFQTGEINTGSFEGGGALKLLDARTGSTTTLLSVPDGIVRDPDVHFDGRRVLVSMRRSRSDDYHIYEVALERRADGSWYQAGLRQLTFGDGVADIDPVYVPDGSIIFASTREPKVCQCNRHVQANLFRMAPDGSGMHQIGRNTLFEGHPTMLDDGRIAYDRWEYVDKHFGPAFGLWTCNPDGTNHALLYGNVGWSPGAMLDARPMPGSRRLAVTFGSCHDRPWGGIAIVDPDRGLAGPNTILATWPDDLQRLVTNRRDLGDGWGGHPSAGQIDNIVGLRPKYEDPFPLTDRFLLCSRMVEGERMGLYLLDRDGPDRLVNVEGAGCYDPMPLAPRRTGNSRTAPFQPVGQPSLFEAD